MHRLQALNKFMNIVCCLMVLMALLGSDASAQPNAFVKKERHDLHALVAKGEAARVIVGVALEPQADGQPPTLARNAQREAVAAAQERLLKRVVGDHISEHRRFRELPYVALEVDSQGLARLLADPDVVSVEEDRRLVPHLTDTPAIVRADLAWGAGYRGGGQAVAVLDTGVDTFHPFLTGKTVAEACFSTPGEGYATLCPSGVSPQYGEGAGTYCPDLSIGCYHGTHVAGIAVGCEGELANGAGMAPLANLIPVQVFARYCDFSNCYLDAGTSDIVAALEWVYAQQETLPIAVVNMSLGGASFDAPCDYVSPAMKSAIDLLRSVNIATVVSSGNDGYLNKLSFPACISTAVSVGATTKQNDVAYYSNAAPFLSLLAPGSNIYSSYPGGGYATKTGTSMAAPHVAGAWALLKAASPASTVNEILEALQTTGLLMTDYRQGLVKPLIQIGDTPTSQGALGALLSLPGSLVNYALAANGGAASASSVHSSNYPVAAINNGDRTGAGWGSGGGWNDATKFFYPDWVQVNFNGQKTISTIDVVTLQDDYSFPTEPTLTTLFSLYGITAFDVQYWTGAAWMTVPGGSVTGNSNVWRRFTFAPVDTSKVRVLINGSLGGYSRIVEVEAWGTTSANQPPAVSLTAPPAGATFTAPAEITLTAAAADPDGTVAKVEFFQGTVKLGEVLAPPYAYQWSNVPAGSYSLTAVATDNLGAATASASVAVTVSGGGTLVNHALAGNGGVASASSVHSAAFPVTAVNNGDRTGAGWGIGGGWNDASKFVYPDWVQVNFNGTRLISEIDVVTLQDNYLNPVAPSEATLFSLYGITAFDVQYWDGSAWVTVPAGSVTGNSNVLRRFSFAPVSTPKIRVMVNGSMGDWSRIVEIEAWGEPAVPLVNHALAGNGGVASASSVHSAGYPVAAVNNGDRSGAGWASGGGWNDASKLIYPDWVQIDLNGIKTISEIVVVTLQDDYQNPIAPTDDTTFTLYGITAFDVQYWDGGAWVTVPGGSVSGNSNVLRRFTFAPISTGQIRVLINGSVGGDWSRVVEVEVWGAQ